MADTSPKRYATRTKDPDQAAAAYRAVATRCSIDARITPVGESGDNGIKLAYELKQRGIAVSFDPLDERAVRSHDHELAWADDDPARLLEVLSPLPAWREG